MLLGKKTYICLIIAGGAYLAHMYFPQYITADTRDFIMTVFGIGTVAALRSALANLVSTMLEQINGNGSTEPPSKE